MSDHITLFGAEDVQRAGNIIQAAAVDMNRAAGQFESSIEMFKQYLDDWVGQLRDVLEKSRSNNDGLIEFNGFGDKPVFIKASKIQGCTKKMDGLTTVFVDGEEWTVKESLGSVKEKIDDTNNR